ncbi:hypothetical protein FHS96_002212 [Sphingomonas zeicaulis]|uniref:hypothetical protein n=1 Tax=Sphingomonas zeicaulis TaxID=1632740 RepID=UPI003D1E51CF
MELFVHTKAMFDFAMMQPAGQAYEQPARRRVRQRQGLWLNAAEHPGKAPPSTLRR